MSDKPIIQAEVSFQSEGRLLQELGERLVASSEVAIVELVKNAYDADASLCRVYLEKNELVIDDTGHGITNEEFKQKWMRIASGFKEKEPYSRDYKRKLTGAKGIGRFAVRFLGKKLTLTSIAFDPQEKIKTRLVAEFDWSMFDETSDLSRIKIPYSVFAAPVNTATGTMLRISELKGDLVFDDKVRTSILKIINPLAGLERGKFSRRSGNVHDDPGFNVELPAYNDDGAIVNENQAAKILSNYWFKLTISLDGNNLDYKIYPSDKNIESDEKKPIEIEPIFERSLQYNSIIKKGLFADIRFFPYRGGMFSGKGFKGFDAWRWVREISGVAVVDHGFRIKPFGYGDDDWLINSRDKAISMRNWRSSIIQKHFPIPSEIKNTEKLNPMLYLPGNHQLVGAVFVESGHKSKSNEAIDLTPSMDREGYLENGAFHQLVDIVRGGVELLALVDKREQERKVAEEAKLESINAAREIKQAIEHIKELPTLSKSDKNRLVVEYSRLTRHIDEIDEYHRQAQKGLETMSLLGVVAGFMTHESRKILHDLEVIREILLKLSRKHNDILEPLNVLNKNYDDFSRHVEYTSMFIKSARRQEDASFNAKAQIELIIEKFGNFADDRGIKIEIEIDDDVEAPKMPITLYSGILLNLFTNALKAVIAGTTIGKHPRVAFKGWNEHKKHVIEVLDNGVGIPPSLEKRIWDPLFTTTSNENNPLGSGMGLGLSIVKKLIKDIGGSIRLIEAPTGFSTCFKIELPR